MTPLIEAIDNAQNSLLNAFGIDVFSASVQFLKTQIVLVIGGGLGFFRILLPFILAVAIIYAIVYFAFRAFRFMRH